MGLRQGPRGMRSLVSEIALYFKMTASSATAWLFAAEKRIFIDLMTSDRELKALIEGSK
jgi:hypothetical protein